MHKLKQQQEAKHFYTQQYENEKIAKRSLNNKVGNCLELTCIAELFFKLIAVDIPNGYYYSVCTLKGGDHMFLLVHNSKKFNNVGSIKFTDMHKLIKKNEVGIILDPWTGSSELVQNANFIISNTFKNYDREGYKGEVSSYYRDGTVIVGDSYSILSINSKKSKYINNLSLEHKGFKYTYNNKELDIEHDRPLEHMEYIKNKDKQNKYYSVIQPIEKLYHKYLLELKEIRKKQYLDQAAFEMDTCSIYGCKQYNYKNKLCREHYVSIAMGYSINNNKY